MMFEERRSFNWMSLLVGILFVLVSLVTFQNPGTSLVAIVIYFTVTAIVNGIYSLFVRSKIKEFTGYRSTGFLVLAIAEILVGIILLFRLDEGIIALAYVFALWFIMDSVRNLFLLGPTRAVSVPLYWFSMIVNIIGIFVGFSLFFDPIVSLMTISFLVGFYLLMNGIIYIVGAFSN